MVMFPTFGTLCCTLPLGLIFLLVLADQRRRVLYRQESKHDHQKAGWLWPSFSTVWPQIDFSAVKLMRKVREEYHFPENGDSLDVGRLCSYTGCMWLGCLRRMGTALGAESSDNDRLHPP